eukprot:scaffold41358_cov21-Cyclotella_meneghiniana.AAC.1
MIVAAAIAMVVIGVVLQFGLTGFTIEETFEFGHFERVFFVKAKGGGGSHWAGHYFHCPTRFAISLSLVQSDQTMISSVQH